MKRHHWTFAITACLIAAPRRTRRMFTAKSTPSATSSASGELDRRVLPIPEPKIVEITEMDARRRRRAAAFEVKAPTGRAERRDRADRRHRLRPLEHLRRADPHADARGDWRSTGCAYNRFHTTALCSPTRDGAADGPQPPHQQRGRDHGGGDGVPGQHRRSARNSVTPLAEILRLNGYSTAAFGKYHETPPWEVVGVGTVRSLADATPGFDKFYGFIGGETNQWAPAIYDGVTRVDAPHDPNYHFTTDMTNQAIGWVQRPAVADAGQAVLHVLRDRRDARAAPRAEGVDRQVHAASSRWAGTSCASETLRAADRDRRGAGGHQADAAAGGDPVVGLAARRTRSGCSSARWRLFAGFAEHTDHEVGRLVEALREHGRARQHAVLLHRRRQRRERRGRAGRHLQRDPGAERDRQRRLRLSCAHIDEWGGPHTFPHFAIGWALAGNTPFQWTKQVASHFGGTRNGMVISWPAQIPRRARRGARAVPPRHRRRADRARGGGSARADFGERHGAVPDGRRLDDVHVRRRAARSDRRTTQYFEMFGNRAIYHDGWVAATRHSIPWLMVRSCRRSTEDRWELYNVAEDFSEANDLAAQNPQKLKELQDVFVKEAIRQPRVPARRPARGALRCRSRRATGPDRDEHVAHAARGHDGHRGERVHQREGSFVPIDAGGRTSPPRAPTA